MPHTERPTQPTAPHRVLGVVFGITLVAMSPALLPGAGYVWDDVALISQNPLMGSLEGLRHMLTGSFFQTEADLDNDYYRPLVSLSYWLEQRLFGGAALAHHWVNLLLHLGCVALVYRWLARRVQNADVPHTPRALWLGFATLLFAVHPSRPESVAWISGRTDPMALLFALGAIELWQRGGRARAPMAALSFTAALLCKETAYFVMLAWLADAWLLEPRTQRVPGGMWAVGALTSVALAARTWLVPPAPRPLGSPAGVLAALGEYVRALLAPFPPTAVLAPPRLTPEGSPQFAFTAILLGGLAACGLAALAVAAWRRPVLRPWLADTLWLVLPLVPVLQVVGLSLVGHVALRFLYIPLLGACALVLRGGLCWSAARAPSPRLLAGLFALVGVLYLPFDLAYASAYRSNRALWEYEAAVDPERSYVLDRLLHTVPLDDLARTHQVAAQGVRVALRDGHGAQAMRMALHWARSYAAHLPPETCPEPLLAALDDLALGRTAHLGTAPTLEVELPAREARGMRERYAPFWTLRAELMIRCGELQQALASLEQAPLAPETALLAARLMASQGDLDGARARLAEARARFPLQPSLTRAARALEQARTNTAP